MASLDFALQGTLRPSGAFSAASNLPSTLPALGERWNLQEAIGNIG